MPSTRHRLRALHHAPAVIAPALDPVDHLPEFPPDIADPQVAGRPVDAHPPGIAQAERPDLGPNTGGLHERIIGRDAVALAGLGVIDVDPQDARKQVGTILPGQLAVRRRRIGSITRGNVKISVITKIQASSVMSARPESDQHLFTLGIDDRRVGPAHFETGDARAVFQVVGKDVTNVDVPVLVEPGMESQPVESREVRMPLRHVERQVGLLAISVFRKRPDPALDLANEEPGGSRSAHERKGVLEFQMREGQLDAVGSRRFGRAGDSRGRPGRPFMEGYARYRRSAPPALASVRGA